MKKQKAIIKLESLIEPIENLKKQESHGQEFKKWKRDTEIAIERIFDKNSRHIKDFGDIRYSLSAFSSGTPDSAFEDAYRRGLDTAKTILNSFIDEIKEYWEESKDEALPQFTEKENILNNKIFIGHGGSALWRELKDFVKDRLKLSWDEFNRVPVAGVTTVDRLKQMLNEATIAFLVLTAEDERSDGKQQARMNVIHEVGLFQGKLGFEKAFILIEEGCEEFSNINGLGQIRFPKGNISAKFEEIRKIVEKENIIT
jgi:predicted nucleotide-binding protein